MSYFKNMGVLIDGSKNKINLFTINFKIYGFRNILKNYLTHKFYKYILPFI